MGWTGNLSTASLSWCRPLFERHELALPLPLQLDRPRPRRRRHPPLAHPQRAGRLRHQLAGRRAVGVGGAAGGRGRRAGRVGPVRLVRDAVRPPRPGDDHALGPDAAPHRRRPLSPRAQPDDQRRIVHGRRAGAALGFGPDRRAGRLLLRRQPLLLHLF